MPVVKGDIREAAKIGCVVTAFCKTRGWTFYETVLPFSASVSRSHSG